MTRSSREKSRWPETGTKTYTILLTEGLQRRAASEPRIEMTVTTGKARGQPAKNWLRMLGPGLVTGAADDDPSGIATYSQGGAQFGYALGWTMFLTTPFMIAIQMVSARIGAVTGQGLAANLGKAMPPRLAIRHRRASADRQYAQYRRRHRRDGRRAAAGRRRPGAGLHRPVRHRLPRRRNPDSVSHLFGIPENPDAGVVRLRRHGVHRPDSMGPGAGRDLRPAPVVGPRLHVDAGGDLRHHDQPLYVLLAGFA